MELRAFARAKEIIDLPDTDEDAMKRSGLSESVIDLVFDAKQRILERKNG